MYKAIDIELHHGTLNEYLMHGLYDVLWEEVLEYIRKDSNDEDEIRNENSISKR